jgi:hypothetical protein
MQLNNRFYQIVELLMSAVAMSLPLDDSLQMRAYLDSLAFSEISTFETAPFEDFLASGSEAIDVRRHYYRLPLKKPNHPDDDVNKPYRTVTYPRESLAAVDKRAQTIVVFYHGEEEVNATTRRSPSCPTVPSC